MSRSRLALAVAIAALLGLAAIAGSAAGGPAPATSASGFDYGDAPDGAPARYAAKPSVRGRFPTRAARGGPRHPAGSPRIGLRWSGEPDSRQVNVDTEEGATLSPRSCATSTVTLVVDATNVEAGAAVYVNAWFDWNQDGDWGEGGTRNCGSEWGIQNFRLDPAALGADRVGVVTLRFRAGRVPAQFWWRVQAHAGPPTPHAAGGDQATPTRGGETDDYFFDRSYFDRGGGTRSRRPSERTPSGRPFVRVFVTPAIARHGGRSYCDWFVNGLGKRSRNRVTSATFRLYGDRDGLRVTRTRTRRDYGWALIENTRDHDRARPIQVADLGVQIRVVKDGKRLKLYRPRCELIVDHSEPLPPAQAPPPDLTPFPDASAGGGADVKVSATINNAFMDRNGNGHVSGVVVVTNRGPEQQAGPLKLTIASNRPESARAAEMGGLACERGESTTTCAISGATVGTEQAYSWALPVSGAGPFSATFSLVALNKGDPAPGNNAATVERELTPEG